jgi:hypothetical protein
MPERVIRLSWIAQKARPLPNLVPASQIRVATLIRAESRRELHDKPGEFKKQVFAFQVEPAESPLGLCFFVPLGVGAGSATGAGLYARSSS